MQSQMQLRLFDERLDSAYVSLKSTRWSANILRSSRRIYFSRERIRWRDNLRSLAQRSAQIWTIIQ